MSARAKPAPPDEGQKVPTWIVSFSDMITLLLSFFVLLQAFAHARDPELFFQGQGSFLRAIRCFGLPEWLFGKEDRPAHEYIRVKHTTEEAKEKVPRHKVLDAEDEKIRLVFRNMQKAIDTQAGNLPDAPPQATATPIRFAPGRADLDASARAWLRRFAQDLDDGRDPEDNRVRVLALAPDARWPKEQWLLSARRARVVADALDAAMPSGAGTWEIASCGAAAGGELWRTMSGTQKKSFVVIVVEKVRD